LNDFTNIFTAFAQNYLMTKFDGAMKDSLAELINNNVASLNTSSGFDVDGVQVEVDYNIID